ncbi:MAG: hypothetical protein GX235_08090 [Clostridiales bacterium]|nr:hypothetical protein [Clostridiales bacterium]
MDDWSITKTFSEEAQIKELAAALYPGSFDTGFKLHNVISNNYYVTVQMKNGSTNTGYYRGDNGFYLITEKIPEWLQRDTAYE